jgi:hypothetical protein
MCATLMFLTSSGEKRPNWISLMIFSGALEYEVDPIFPIMFVMVAMLMEKFSDVDSRRVSDRVRFAAARLQHAIRLNPGRLPLSERLPRWKGWARCPESLQPRCGVEASFLWEDRERVEDGESGA